MKLTRSTVPAALCATLLLATTASASTIVSDDFEVDSSASYIVRDEANSTSGDGTPDSVSTFAFDYITAGLPLAPRSQAGDIGGLRFAVNETSDDAGAADHITAFYNAAIGVPAYTMKVDMYMGVESASGTTEFAHIGVGSDGTDFNSIFTPIAGDGQFISITGEGGSSSDYRHFVSGTPVNDGDGSYLNSANTTNATGDTYQAIFPSPPSQFAGSPGNQWATVTISVNPNRVLYSVNGTPIIIAENAETAGFVSLGYTDPFSSVGPHFVVYDNLVVTEVPEPTTCALAVLALGGLLLKARKS